VIQRISLPSVAMRTRGSRPGGADVLKTGRRVAADCSHGTVLVAAQRRDKRISDCAAADIRLDGSMTKRRQALRIATGIKAA